MLHGNGMLLVSLIGGYWLLERAENHKGELRRIGRLLGGLVIILALFGLIAGAWGSCPWKRGGWAGSFGKKVHAPAAPVEQETIMVTPSGRKKR